jgi:hypothetical protein
MRPTDFCHPYESCVPAPRAFPVRSRSFRRGDVLRSLGLRRADRGTGCFTTPEDRFGGSSSITALVLRASRPSSRAWAFSSHGGRCDRASDTPVATCRFHPHASGVFTPAATWPCGLSPLLEEEVWHGSEGGPAAETIVRVVS